MNSARYWLERCKALEKLVDEGCRATSAELGLIYDAALEYIMARIRRLYRRFTDGYGVTPAELESLLSVTQTREARRELEKLLEDCTDPNLRAEILKKLDAPAYAYRIARMEALLDQVYFDAKAIGVKEVQLDKARLVDIYKTSYARTSFDLSQAAGRQIPFAPITNRRAAIAIQQYWTPNGDELGQNFSQRVWGNTTQLAENVREIITRGLMTGESYRDMADELRAQMGDVGAQKVIQPDGSTRTVLTGSGAKYRATRLIRTEGNHISGQAVIERYEDAGIERYLYRALLELRTCGKCGRLDGKSFPVSEQKVGVNMHPMHPNCRCFISPDMTPEELKEITRSAQTGADNWDFIPADMTWEEWRKKYVDGNPEMRAQEKMDRNRAKDREQWRDFKDTLGKDAPKNLADFQKLKYTEPEKWDELKTEYRVESAHKQIEAEIQKGPGNDDFGAVVRKNHIGLRKYTPESMKNALEQAGFTIQPLNRGNYKGVPFEQGGGYKTNYGGNGIFQYHPPARSHHGGAYWKVNDTREQRRYGMDGTEK